MKRLILVALVVLIGMTAPAYAKKKSGFYLGGSVGYSAIAVEFSEVDLGDVKFNETDVGFKAYGGYRLIPFLAVEGGYVDFGNPSGTLSNDEGLPIEAEIGLNGWDLSAVGILPLGIFDLFARVGYFWWDADVKAAFEDETDRESDSGSDLTYGIGGQVWLGQLAIRGEIELFDISEADNVWMFSAGVAYRF